MAGDSQWGCEGDVLNSRQEKGVAREGGTSANQKAKSLLLDRALAKGVRTARAKRLGRKRL